MNGCVSSRGPYDRAVARGLVPEAEAIPRHGGEAATPTTQRDQGNSSSSMRPKPLKAHRSPPYLHAGRRPPIPAQRSCVANRGQVRRGIVRKWLSSRRKLPLAVDTRNRQLPATLILGKAVSGFDADPKATRALAFE
jgi:hypothetical protein